MKRLLHIIVLFVLVILTVIALSRMDSKSNTSAFSPNRDTARHANN